MVFEDLREFLVRLEAEGELVRVKKQVEDGDEIFSIMWELYDRKGIDAPVLVFENVKGYDIPVVKNVFGAYRRWALALDMKNWRETTRTHVIKYLANKLEAEDEWREPRILDSSPCKEVILKEDDVDLRKFPILKWHPDDGGPYITLPGVITKDPKLGGNLGMYRMHVYDHETIGMSVSILQDVGIFVSRARATKKEVDCAVAIGFPPVLHLAAAMKMPEVGRYSEFRYAGALTGKPIDLVKCETVDLEVPATSEIVLEGKLAIEDVRLEGPFAEWMGYSQEALYNPTFKVKCITHREKPVYVSAISAHRYSEVQILYSIPWINWYNQMKRAIAGFRDADIPLECRNYVAVIQIKKRQPGWGKQAIHTALGSGFGMGTLNCVIVVDEDIDIYDWNQVLFALGTRVDPELDVTIIPGTGVGALNPAARARIIRDPTSGYTNFAICSKIGIDATCKMKEEPGRERSTPNVVKPLPDSLSKVREKWDAYGLTKFC